MKRFLIVDGHNLLFRMFYGMPSRINDSTGQPVHAVVGFIGAYLKLLRLSGAEHTAVIFDGEHPSTRIKLLPEYKIGRRDYSDTPPEGSPYSQLPLIKTVLDELRVYHTETAEGMETDDVIASCAQKFSDEFEVLIASQDRDFFGIVNDRIKLFDYHGDQSVVWDADHIRRRYGVEPEFFADLKAITGDRSDNIRGVTGVGEKTAAMLIARFGHFETILENAARIKRSGVREAIVAEAGMVRNNLRLIKLTDRAVPPFDEPPKLTFDPASVTTLALLEDAGIVLPRRT